MNIKTPVSWVGNKTSILPIVYAAFPNKYERYIEPFGGSGAVLLGKEKPDKFEVYNDYNQDLVNLFLCMRDRPMALINELGFMNLNSRAEFKLMTAFLEKKPTPKLSLEEEIALTKKMFPPLEAKELIELQIKNAELYNVKRAAIFLKVLRYSYSSTGKSFGSQPFDIRGLFDLIEKVSGRLQPVVIENKDFQAVMEQYDRENALIYCDPPYFDTENMYKGGFTMDDHMRLFNTFREAKGKVLISYNDCAVARKTYDEYCIMSFSRVHSMAQKYEPGKEFHELLIANYDILEREKNKPYQLTIFDSGESAEVSNLLKGSVIHYGRKII